MSISISVVGIFFGADLDLDSDTKVIDVLSAASAAAANGLIHNVTAFGYDLSKPPNTAATSFSSTYTDEFKGRGVGKTYPAGEYFLPEDLNALPAYKVWQYYVLNAEGISTTNGGVRYLDDPNAIVPVGGRLIWRLVSILGGPNSAPAIASARQVQTT